MSTCSAGVQFDDYGPNWHPVNPWTRGNWVEHTIKKPAKAPDKAIGVKVCMTIKNFDEYENVDENKQIAELKWGDKIEIKVPTWSLSDEAIQSRISVNCPPEDMPCLSSVEMARRKSVSLQCLDYIYSES